MSILISNMPQAMQWKVIKSIHDTIHLGRDATQGLINCSLWELEYVL
jgi:hypothetical protein